MTTRRGPLGTLLLSPNYLPFCSQDPAPDGGVEDRFHTIPDRLADLRDTEVPRHQTDQLIALVLRAFPHNGPQRLDEEPRVVVPKALTLGESGIHGPAPQSAAESQHGDDFQDRP